MTTPVPPPSHEESNYDVFVSYARQDNASGWVKALVEQLQAFPAPQGALPLRVFVDWDEIHGMDDWRNRIEGGLRRSKVLLVCLSERYLASRYCAWEWQHFHFSRPRRRQGVVQDTAVVRFVKVPDSGVQLAQEWMLEVQRSQHLIDLQPWVRNAQGELQSPHRWLQDAEQQRIAGAAFARLWDNIASERVAQRTPGNLRGHHPYFVGRVAALRELHRELALKQVGVVCAVQGLGGIGKTELALQYAHEHAWSYSAGMWQLNAEGHGNLLELLATLADDPRFCSLYGIADSQKATSAEGQGRQVFQVLADHARQMRAQERNAMSAVGYQAEPQGGGAALLILDNVSDPGLLGTRELVKLPELAQARELVRLLATTRLGRDQMPARGVAVKTLDRLDDVEALAMFMAHRREVAFPDAAYAQGVQALIERLGGWTLPIEQVSLYLALNADVHPADLLQRLERRGLHATDELLKLDDRVKGELLHHQGLIDIVLGETLADLEHSPLALLALRIAAALPPDHIRIDWLEAIARALDATAFEAELGDPWAKAMQRLQTRQLLLPADRSHTVRLHRVLGDYVRTRLAEIGNLGAAAIDAAVARQAEQIALWLARYTGAEFSRARLQAEALLALSDYWQMKEQTGQAQALVADVASSFFLRRLSSPLAGPLAQRALRIREKLAQANKGDSQAQRAVSISLDKVAEFLLRRGAPGDAAKALEHLERSLSICEKLAQANEGDSQAQRDVSISLNKVAEFLLRRGAPGDAAKALEHLERSLSICERLAQANEGDSQAQRDVSISLDRVAEFLLRRGAPWDAAKALEHLERSLSIFEKLAQSNEGDSQAQRDVSISLDRVAEFLLRRGAPWDAAKALEHLERSLSIFEKLAQSNEDDSQAQRDVSVSLNKVAEFLLRRGAPGDAAKGLEHLERSLSICEKLAQANEGDSQAQRDVSVSLNKVAEFLLRRGAPRDAAKALEHLERSLSIRETLAQANEGDSQAQRDVSVSLNKVAEFLLRRGAAGDAAKALEHLERSLSICEKLAQANEGDSQAQRDVSVSLNKVAEFLLRRGAHGDAAKALEHLERSLSIFEKLAQANEGDSQAQRDVSISLDRVAEFLLRRGAPGDAAKALGHLERSLSICEKLAQANEDDSQAQRDVSISLDRVAEFLLRRGAPGDAAKGLEHLERSLSICEKLAQANEGDSQAQRDVSVSLNKVAEFLLRRGAPRDAAKALEHLERSLSIRETLAQANEDDSQAQRDVSVSLNKVAEFLLRRGAAGDAAKGLEHLERSLSICERLAQANEGDSQAQRDLAVVCERLAEACWATGRQEEALSTQRKAFGIHRDLFEACADAQSAGSLSIASYALAHRLVSKGNLTESEMEEVQQLFSMAHQLLTQLQEAGALESRLQPLLEELDRMSSKGGEADTDEPTPVA